MLFAYRTTVVLGGLRVKKFGILACMTTILATLLKEATGWPLDRGTLNESGK